MSNKAIQVLRGARDFYPEDMRIRSWLFDHFRATARSFAFDPEGRLLAGGTVGFEIVLWDTSNWEPRVLHVPEDSISSVAFSPDGQSIAFSADYTRTVHLYDVESHEPIGGFEGHANRVNAVAFSADCERLFTAGSDGFVGVWDVAERRPIRFLRQ